MTIFKVRTGQAIGFQEIVAMGFLLMMYFSILTWGTNRDKDDVIEEERKQKIEEKSAKISYFILMIIILIALAADQIINGFFHPLLLAVLGMAMILLPLVEFFVARKVR